METVNIYTKKAYGRREIDLCAIYNINPEVARLYYCHQELCNSFVDPSNADITAKKYYVYAWHTVETPKRFFYVGKGTGKRYVHIENEIAAYKNGETKNIRFKQYSIIKETCGIACDFVLENLTEYEALIYEECLKLEFLKNGEVLLNVEGIPQEYLPDGWRDDRASSPILDTDKFRIRYLNDNSQPAFDKVKKVGLLATATVQ